MEEYATTPTLSYDARGIMAFRAPHFIVNPRSSSRQTTLRLESLRNALPGRFPSARWMPTEAAGHAADLAREAALEGGGLVVAVGGDGTINEVANGLMSVPPDQRPTLGIVPAGSGSDFARMLRIPRDVPGALAVLANGNRRRIDVGEIECAAVDPLQPATRRHFVNIAGCGSSGRVVQRFNMRHVPGRFGYLVASVQTAIDYAFPHVEIALDDGPPDPVMLTILFVCNGEYCGGGMHVGNGAAPDDGLFHVVEIDGVGRIGAMLQWPRLYVGNLTRVRGARVRTAKTVRVTSAQDVMVDCDGELCGRLPATYRIVADALNVCIPARRA